MKIGFIGTGSFARQHAAILRELGLEIAACYGTNKAKTIKFSQDFNSSIYAAPLDLVQRDVIDVLYIAVPPHAHEDGVELRALDENIPFLCEKPVGLSLSLCQAIAEKVKEKKLVTSSGYLLRYEPLFDSVKKVIERNSVSSIRACSYSYMPQVHWWRSEMLGGGMMVESGSHYIDLLRYLFGEIYSVDAVTSQGSAIKNYPGCDIYDSMESIFTFRNGQIGSLGVTHLLNSIDARNDRLEVYGHNFTLHVDLCKLRYKGEAIALYKEFNDKEWIEIKNATSKTMLLRNETIAFLNAIKAAQPCSVKSSYPDAVITLQVALAMNQSAKRNRSGVLFTP